MSKKHNSSKSTSSQPFPRTPIVRGKDAVKIYEEAHCLPSLEAKLGAEKLAAMFEKDFMSALSSTCTSASTAAMQSSTISEESLKSLIKMIEDLPKPTIDDFVVLLGSEITFAKAFKGVLSRNAVCIPAPIEDDKFFVVVDNRLKYAILRGKNLIQEIEEYEAAPWPPFSPSSL